MAESVKIMPQVSDVGELLKLLPSDIFPVEQEILPEPKSNINMSSSNSSNNNCSKGHHLHCMAEGSMLAQPFGTLSLLEPVPPNSSNQRNPKPFQKFQWVRYDVPCMHVGPSPPPPGILPLWCIVQDASTGVVHGVHDPRTGCFRPVIIPVYTCPFYVPVQTGAGGSGEGAAAGAVQSQQNSRVSNRVLPLPGGRAGNGGGSMRGHNGGGGAGAGGGTGVYLPRKAARTSSTAANNNTAGLARKRQSMRSRQRGRFVPKKSFPETIDNKKQEDYDLNQLPFEINLPTEWTY